MATKTSSARASRKIKVGDHVIRIAGKRRFPAVVVEDRGFIGVGGRQLIAIRRVGVPDYMAEPYEVAAEEVELVSNGSSGPQRQRKMRQHTGSVTL